MQPPQHPPDRSNPNPSPLPEDSDFETAIAEIERSLQQLKARYTQVQHDIQQQDELQTRQKQLKKQTRRHRHPQLQAELANITQQLEHLAIALESSLEKEPFWQVVRFGGLGIIIGWLLKSCSG